MDLYERVKEILANPENEWAVVEQEDVPLRDVLTRYVAILAAIPALCGIVGAGMVGYGGGVKIPMSAALIYGIAGYLMSFGAVYAIAWSTVRFAPKFGASADMDRGMRLAAFGLTPGWLAGIFKLWPAMSVVGLLAGAYSLYLMWMGAQRLMKVPKEKAITFVAFAFVPVAVAFLVLGFVLSSLVGMLGGAPRVM